MSQNPNGNYWGSRPQPNPTNQPVQVKMRPDDDGKKSRSKVLPRVIIYGVVLVAAVIGLGYYWSQNRRKLMDRMGMNKVELEVGPETTVIAGPKHPDGTIDYVSSLNDQYGALLSASDNAAVEMVRAIGPTAIPLEARAATLKRLELGGMSQVSGEYFVTFYEYCREEGLTRPEQNRLRKQYDAAQNSPWTADQQPDAAKFIRSNEPAMQRLIDASHRRRYHLPLVSPSDPDRLMDVHRPLTGTTRDLVSAMIARAMLRAGSGDGDQAVNDLLAIQRLARLYAAAVSDDEWRTGYALETLSLRAAASMAAADVLSRTQLERLRDGIDKMPELREPMHVVDRYCRYRTLDTLQTCAAEGLLDTLHTYYPDSIETIGLPGAEPDYAEVMRRANDHYDRQLQALQVADGDLFRRQAGALGRQLRDLKIANDRIRFEGGAGEFNAEDLLFAELTGNYMHLRRQERMVDRENAMARTALAVGLYREKEGQLPQKLADLQPVYLKQIPQDPHGQGPLRWTRTGDGGAKIYSVGLNGTDDGGETNIRTGADDPSVKFRP
ncbi:MAG: hypothetical protein ACLFVU_13675 [Phycisphaerae bacterium]